MQEWAKTNKQNSGCLNITRGLLTLKKYSLFILNSNSLGCLVFYLVTLFWVSLTSPTCHTVDCFGKWLQRYLWVSKLTKHRKKDRLMRVAHLSCARWNQLDRPPLPGRAGGVDLRLRKLQCKVMTPSYKGRFLWSWWS